MEHWVQAPRAQVLVITSDPVAKRHVTDALAADHHVVALEGRTAMETMRAEPPDLVVTTSLEVVERIAGQRMLDDIAMLLLGGPGPLGALRRRGRLGAYDFVDGPFDLEVIRARAAHLVELTRARLTESRRRAEWDAQRRELEAVRQTARLAREEVESAREVRSHFLSLVSHELRTPLASLRILVEIMEREFPLPDPDRYQELVNRLGASTVRLTDHVDTLLAYTRIESGRLAFRPEPFAPRQLCNDALAELAARARSKGLALTFDITNERLFHSDPRLLRLVLGNLVGNAIKFTDEGEVHLTIALSGNDLELSVCDTGPGIPRALQQRVFEPFFRVNGEHQGARPGVGLGLSIVRDVVQCLHGTLALASEPGRTEFRVRIPEAEVLGLRRGKTPQLRPRTRAQ